MTAGLGTSRAVRETCGNLPTVKLQALRICQHKNQKKKRKRYVVATIELVLLNTYIDESLKQTRRSWKSR